ncbi:MAG: response regulator transcription factor [Alphaproteobacteria bacterium]|nr:response regulator transcription factor [Alphaproteobacteria bacterium]
MRILIVEDDMAIGTSLKKGLGYNGYAAEHVASGAEALTAIENDAFNILILDINLPDMSGIEVLRKIRADKKLASLPVILLTARDGTDNKVKGLDAGADDYMTKPFDIQELLARVRALSRRGGQPAEADNIYRARDIELDMAAKRAKKAGENVVLTANELKVLSLLMERPGHLVGKATLEEALYGWDGEVDSNTVEVTIYNLRKKLGRDSIKTMRGIGYMVQP